MIVSKSGTENFIFEYTKPNYMKQLLGLLLVLTTFTLSAQKSIIVCGDAYQIERPTTVTVLSCTRQAVGAEFVHLADMSINLNDKFYQKIVLEKPRLIMIHYLGSANIVYAYPGDSIHISFTKLSKPDTIKSMAMTFINKEDWHYSGNDSGRIAFFETIVKKTGITDNPPFKMDITEPGFLAAYKNRVNGIYKQRLSMLDSLSAEYHFKNDFKKVATDEIRGEYLSSLMNLTFIHELWNEFPAGYFDDVEHEDITWEKAKDTRMYRSMLYTKIMYFDQRVENRTDEQKLAAAFENATKFKDDSVRDCMMTYILSKNLDKQPDNFDGLFEKYLSLCTNPDYVKGLTTLYHPAVLNKPLPYDVLNASLKTNVNKPVKLQAIITTGRPVLIDFWASWCGPCRKEIPELQNLAKKYKGQMDFRFISVDVPEKETAWLKAIKETNLDGEQYVIQDNAIINFAHLKSIPRYFILDKNGNLTAFRGPNLLIDAGGFEQQIKAVIAN